ncbi:UDP-glycosyltransferase 86A1-like isoform X2 [Salvia miltiorrhiza]|uniref:UDP-glycosyltransferase 86A1-like isoform X2 n=1 Tax=Salvia miltiorrhiza TaxID=226208 RepID=UPI0025ACE21F|nr:UDP-glycosyltransferase 86A1-like isoform X2 [Salvia miltiorrhiza]
MGSKKLHAIMIGFCYQGHIIPFINLAMKLASNGCAVTFVHTDYVHHMLTNADGVVDADPFLGARQSGLDIRYATISDGFPLDFDRIHNFKQHWEAIFLDFPSRVDELLGNIIPSESDDAHFLVADTFYSWPATIAQKYNILNVSFWTQPALVFAIDYHLDLLREKGYFPIKGDEENVIVDIIPGIQPIKTKDLMSNFHDFDETSTTNRIVVEAFQQVKRADFILINTVNELEHESVLAINQKQPTYAIGPLNFTIDSTKTAVPKSLWAEADCAEWLDSKPRGSVLYVSFGSLAQSNQQLAEEIANGLLLSGVHFVWVIRNGADVLPDGFENEMCKDQGLIVSWCNQNAVLSNPAIGGFLTHCGWNSILETIWCGVPVICYPFFADQPTNRKLVVDDWKVGINLCDGISVDRKEVAAKIKQLMSAEASNGLRDEMKKMSAVMHSALDEDGSTHTSFHQFLDHLWARAQPATHA